MEILILESKDAVAAFGAEIFAEQVRKKPASVLGLATGGSPLALYDKLAALHRNEALSFRDITSFNLDEYFGLSSTDARSYRHYMREHLFSRIDIDESRAHLPACRDDEDPWEKAEAYEAAIREAGGIDLQLLGIGRNGHIGFNEPTSSLASRTRVKTLAEDTMRDNRDWFREGEPQPELAMTMGIGTILEATEILLIATGSHKAPAVRRTIEGPVASVCPASALQLHASVTILLDPDAAAELELTRYYQTTGEHQARLLERWKRPD